MQTVASEMKWLRGLLLAALYVSMFGCATPPAPVTAAPPIAAPATPPAAAPAAVLGSASLPEPVVVTETPGAAPAGPHFALILPLNSALFGKAADAVQQGFLAAAAQEKNGLPVRVYPCADENIDVNPLYRQAIKAGAVAVAGPLTRNGVAALAANAELMTPTLALNSLEGNRSDQLFFFGLPPEVEARQSAQRATEAGMLSVTIVSSNSPLSKRLSQAFSETWQRAGGVVRAEIVYSGDPTALQNLPLDPGHAVFLAAEQDKARLLRPYINSTLPVYATSQIFSGNSNTLTNYDLADVRFVDMPWMVQADHPAVMVYARSAVALPADQDRLYALGIDAFRLLQILFEHDISRSLPLDGVTGKVNLIGHQFQREATFAVMRQGVGVPVENKPHP